jgi:nitroimidazol reductase NimA-like FMN-containing flavoprotein (pyridoxamine 5'-phosphate oxidase superfamily)
MTVDHMNDNQRDSHLTVIPHAECRDLLESTTVGRVAFVNDDGLQLIPLNFAVIDGYIFFRTSTDSILNDLADGVDEVVFGVDYHAPHYRDGWNVTVKGSTFRVTDPVVHEQVMSWSRLHPWAGGERDVVIRLDPRSMEGRRVSSH